MDETIDNIKKSISRQKASLDYVYNFLEEIDCITDADVLLHIATIVKIKHLELLKKKDKNQTLITPAKKEDVEKPTEENFRTIKRETKKQW